MESAKVASSPHRIWHQPSLTLLFCLLSAAIPPPARAQETNASDVSAACATNVCSNGGTCFVVQSSFQCACPVGFTGTLCEVQQRCPDSPCPPGSLCLAGACRCPQGFTLESTGCVSTLPALPRSPCEQSPCENGGVCLVSDSGAATCSCPKGTAGGRCQLITGNPGPDACGGVVCASGQRCVARGPLTVCAPAAVPVDNGPDPCDAFPCLNNGLCSNLPGGEFQCTCPDGWTGELCESDIVECRFGASPCLNDAACQEAPGGFNCICRPGFTGQLCEAQVDECAGVECLNGGECVDGVGSFSCRCLAQWSGALCEKPFDACSESPCGANGICVPLFGRSDFECQCSPGFAGLRCEEDEDDCAGVACPNNQICIDGVREHTCACPPGFGGSDCLTPVTASLFDECASLRNPCQNGGTCSFHEVAGMSCICPAGTTGERCEAPTPSPCDAEPCNGGYCRPHPLEPTQYECECSRTGRTGPTCLEEADMCVHANPCVHGGSCRRTPGQGRGYACACLPGFNGFDCEADFPDCAEGPCRNGGRCFERSKPANFMPGLIPGPFDPMGASGFFCACPVGTSGERCELVDSGCGSDVCRNGGTCSEDPENGVRCACDAKWEGDRCEEARKNCASIPSPCAQDTDRCVDTVQGPKCLCKKGWGGQDCSFQLRGCDGAPCGPGFRCTPLLGPGGLQLHSCACPRGKGGAGCSSETVASFSGDSLLAYITNPPPSSYNLSLAFRTTVPATLLVSGADILGSAVFTLTLSSEQQLDLKWGRQKTSLMLPPEAENLADGAWRVVSVGWAGTQLHWRLHTASGHELLSQTLSLPTQTSPVFNTRFGGAPVNDHRSGIHPFALFPSHTGGGAELDNYIGCMGDMEVNGMTVIPAQHLASSVNLALGCERQEQCSVGQCSGHGECRDLWTRSECSCARPWLGPACRSRLPAATFGHESAADARSFAQVRMSREEEEALELDTDVSLLLRTRAGQGSLFYLGSRSNPNPQLDTFIAAELVNGQLSSNVKLGGQDIVTMKGGPRLDDGKLHSIRIHRVENDVMGYVDDEQVFAGKLEHPFPHPLLATHFFLAGHPPLSLRRRRQVGIPPSVSLNPAAFSSETGFKGVLRDVRVNGRHVPFFPLKLPQLDIQTLGQTLLGGGVLEGEVSDDTCVSEPCGNGGTCSVTFNDFECRCIAGWRGKDCFKKDFCAELNICPADSLCSNTENGFLCGGASSLRSDSSGEFVLTEPTLLDNSLRLRIRTRQRDGVVLYAASRAGSFLLLALRNGGLDMEYQLDADSSLERNLTRSDVADGEWHGLHISLSPDQSFLELDGGAAEKVLFLEGRPRGDISALFAQQEPLYVGHLPPSILASAPGRFAGVATGFKGCLDGIQIGTQLKPISLLSPTAYGRPEEAHFAPIRVEGISPGCRGDEVCGPDGVVGPCENGSPCRDLWNLRQCDCVTGFSGELCEVNIDDCAAQACDALHGRCIDGVASYTCACAPGYEGQFCERETNECLPAPCKNGATCVDQIGAFQCQCGANFTGDFCEFLITVDCESSPCMNGGSCSDNYVGPEQRKSFECACRPGYFGRTCDFEVDYCELSPCRMGATCISLTDRQDYQCICRDGYAGKNCDEEIDECASGPCLNGATCVDGLGNFTCVCRGGWVGPQCADDVDECASELPCLSGGTCINSPGAFACSCPEFFLGERCELAGTCLTRPCGPNGACVQTQAARHSCDCRLGYTGAACETEIDYCESTPCQEGGLCIRKVGGFDCQCVPGFRGPVCEENIDECEPGPCHNGGLCRDGRNSFSCLCDGTGFSGPDCGADVNECADRANCEAGDCRNFPGSYECVCRPGFVGERCAHRDPCSSGSPLNGTQHDSPSSASLTAESPSRGTRPTPPSSPCANGGRCHNARVEGPREAEEVSFDCDCAEGFTGARCAVPVKQVSPASGGTPLLYIIGPIVGVALLIGIVAFASFLMVAKRKRANRGTYSPSRQEMTGARVQMGPMIKPPPQERLI